MELIHQWSKLHSDFVTLLFATFKELNIRYFVLRNYEGLPDKNTGKDIDIVISPHEYHLVKGALLSVMRKYGIQYYQITQFDRMRCWYIMDYKKNFGIHIDIIENEVYKGFRFYAFDYLYDNTTEYNGFIVLNKPMDTMMLLIQNLVAYKSLKEKYRNTIKENYATNKREINAEIIKFWGKKVGLQLINYLERNNFDAIVKYSLVLGRTAMRRILLKSPIRTIFNIQRFLIGKFYRIIWCPKKYWRFIAVEAPDGTGKTTFINNLIVELRKYYVSDEKRFCVHHFRPSILPNLGAAGEKMKVMKQDKDFTNPHRAKPANGLSSFIRMLYYWIDYVIGIPIILRKEVQYERYTIFDRYIYDFLVDPERSRISLPKWIRLCFSKLVVKPQIVFVLNADPDVIYERKQELTKCEITRQLEDFHDLKKTCKNVTFIDANQTPQEMVEQAMALIMDKFLDKSF